MDALYLDFLPILFVYNNINTVETEKNSNLNSYAKAKPYLLSILRIAPRSDFDATKTPIYCDILITW